MACCLMKFGTVATSGKFSIEYWTELWIRKAIPPPTTIGSDDDAVVSRACFYGP